MPRVPHSVPQLALAALPPMFSDRPHARIAVRTVRDIGGPWGTERSRRVMSLAQRAVWSSLAVLVASGCADAQTARTGRAPTIEDYHVIRTLGAPEISPGRRWVAYSVGNRNEPPSEIWLSAIDGRNERQHTHTHEGFIGDVALSRVERVRYDSRDGTPRAG